MVVFGDPNRLCRFIVLSDPTLDHVLPDSFGHMGVGPVLLFHVLRDRKIRRLFLQIRRNHFVRAVFGAG
jgi:hypothetical protein